MLRKKPARVWESIREKNRRQRRKKALALAGALAAILVAATYIFVLMMDVVYPPGLIAKREPPSQVNEYLSTLEQMEAKEAQQ